MTLANSVLSRRLLVVGLFIGLAVTLVAAVCSQVETVEDRKSIAMRCTELSDRLKKKATDNEALKELVTTMKGNWSFARVHAAIGLGNAGANAMPAIQDLIEAMDSTDLALKAEAIIAVGKVSKDSTVGVDPLIRKLSDGWHKASLAADALAMIGAPAQKAIEPLQRLAKESDNSIAVSSAKKAIEEIQAAVKKANSKQ